MSNLTIFKNPQAGGVVARKGLTPLAQSLVRPGSNMRQIQTNTNGTFRRVVGGEAVGAPARGEIDVIIVNLLPTVSRQFYANDYDPNATPALPDCWSDDGKAPSHRAKNRQSPNCDICPRNIVGSGKNGGRACRYKRNIAVLLVGDPEGEVYRMSVPATSLFGKGVGNTHPFESYYKYLLANNESPDNVVTNVSYDIDAQTMKLVFTPVRHINEVELAMLEEAQASEDAHNYVLMVGEDNSPTASPTASPTPHPVQVQKPTQPEPVKEEPTGFFSAPKEEADVAAPKKRGRPAGSAASAAQKPDNTLVDINKLIADWDNEEA
ncbi:MAG: hypothetical protein DDT36_00698 [Firmicutes bacterium]|nr:hypothetical protein [Bacillota bacterium]